MGLLPQQLQMQIESQQHHQEQQRNMIQHQLMAMTQQ